MSNLEATGIKWHPGFYSAAELEFSSNRGDLEFQREYNLGKEPFRMDLLVIKRLSDTCIENELGHIFKKYNVIEYKSPDDSLTIDDYFKIVGYACLYKGLGEIEDQISAEEVTVSIFREKYPRKLLKKLTNMGCTVKEYQPGIYYLIGQKVLFDTQIIVTRQLDKKTHYFLRVLSSNVLEDDVECFLNEAASLMEPGERNNVDAVLQVSVSANQEIYERIRRRDRIMCNALKELMKEEFEEIQKECDKMQKECDKMQKERDEMQKERDEMQRVCDEIQIKYDNMKEENEKTLLTTIKNLMDSMRWTAKQAMAAMKISDTDQEKYMAKLQQSIE